MEKTQREYYLNEQMKAIQKELGDGDERDDIAEFEEKIENTKLSKEARDKALAELKKLKQMSPMSAEATVVRNYLDWLLSIPWGIKGKVKKDLAEAQEILDKEHYGLEKVKERIVEYLAVQSRTNKLKGPILCLVGPPGVGKTSLGMSIANATGREFVRMSLGGVRDEAEIRGHRRTYIGSMPGKVIQSMKKAKRTNPLFLLDEIDKMGSDFRGDPAAALLEVLDPEQNHTFNDHYLEVDYDLSSVMFVTTANTMNIPAGPARPHGDHPSRRLHRGREDRDRQAPPDPQPAPEPRPGAGRVGARGRGAAGDHPPLHPRGGRAQPRARDRQARAQGGEGHPDRDQQDRAGSRRQPRALPGRAEVPLRRGRAGGPGRRRHRPGLDRGRRRDPDRRRRHDAGQGQDVRHRQPARRHEGVDPGRQRLRALARARRSAFPRRCSRRRTSTCTCRRAPRPRTVPRPASPW